MNLQLALQLLNLKAGCSLADVKFAYRKAAMKTHPDKGGKTEEYIQIKSAYDYLNKFGTEVRRPVFIRTVHSVWTGGTTTNSTVIFYYFRAGKRGR